MAESRQELLAWVNELLMLDLTKIDQCGTGAVYCQLMDSINLDVPMSKVRFDVNSEYQYLNNFKILQSIFTRHKIDRSIPVERLVKCRFQDNLEFLQWMRKYWEQNFPGHDYDPLARRKAGPLQNSAPRAASGTAQRRVVSTGASSTASRSVSSSSHGSGAVAPTRVAGAGLGIAGVGVGGASTARELKDLKERVSELEQENAELTQTAEIVESERNFYFEKLYDIELLMQRAADGAGLQSGGKEDGEERTEPGDQLSEEFSKLSVEDVRNLYVDMIREVQIILYKTTEGFEIPDREVAESEGQYLEETF
jgi:RP/EB family microtubule-associated protein